MKLPPVSLLAIILYSVCASLAAEKAANAKDDALAVFPGSNPAASPTPREKAWVTAHSKREARLQQGNADVLLIGGRKCLSLVRLLGTDTVRNLFLRFTQGTVQAFWRPLWQWLLPMFKAPAEGFSLDLDSTVFQRSGEQEGVAKGYNPSRPGRKTHARRDDTARASGRNGANSELLSFEHCLLNHRQLIGRLIAVSPHLSVAHRG